MSWTPTEQVFDESPYVDNLLAFIAENDDAALAWATGGNVGELPGFNGLYPNASGRLTTLFPALVVVSQILEAPQNLNDGDALIGQYSLTLQMGLSGPNADALALTTKTYAVALASMLMNIDAVSLTDGSLLDVAKIVPLGYRTTYDEIGRGGMTASSWLQITQIRVEYQLISQAFL